MIPVHVVRRVNVASGGPSTVAVAPTADASLAFAVRRTLEQERAFEVLFELLSFDSDAFNIGDMVWKVLDSLTVNPQLISKVRSPRRLSRLSNIERSFCRCVSWCRFVTFLA